MVGHSSRTRTGLCARFGETDPLHQGLYSLLFMSWLYLHVRAARFMTMDYFLLLCSLLLPAVSAVEGKILYFYTAFTMSEPRLKDSSRGESHSIIYLTLSYTEKCVSVAASL